jgi:peroxiredoxin
MKQMKIRNSFFGIALVGILMVHSAINAQGVGTIAPDFTLKDLNNNDFILSEQTGKVVFIFFFGHGCPHCHTNAENTEVEVQNYFSSRDDFVAIGIDGWDGTNNQVQDFKDINELSYTMLLDGSDVMGDFETSHDRLFVIDQVGVVKYISPGYATKEASVEARTVITELLENTSSVNEISTNNMLFYPNPVSDLLTIENPFSSNHIARAEIIDITGRVVLTMDMDFENTLTSAIDVSQLPVGWYALRLRNNDGNVKISDFMIDRI